MFMGQKMYALLSRCIFLPRKLFHPMISICFYSGGNTLEQLIGIEAENNRSRRKFKHERTEEGKRKNYTPNADKIVYKHEIRVSAASDYSANDRHFV